MTSGLNHPSLAELSGPFLATPASHELHLRLGKAFITVRTNSLPLQEDLTCYFRGFLADPKETPPPGDTPIAITALEMPSPDFGIPYTAKEPEPGKRTVKEEFADVPGGRVVRKRLTGMIFLFGGGFNVAIGPCAANPNQVINFINNRYIELLVNEGCLLFHASGIAQDGRGLAIAGFAGMGKSTLALHVMRHGPSFVSNDRLMVQSDSPKPGGALTMYGVAKMPRINPGTVVHNPALHSVIPEEQRRQFLAMAPSELWRLEQKYDAMIDKCFGPGRFELQSPMTGLVLLNWRLGAGPMQPRLVNLDDRPDLFPAFRKPVGLFFDGEGAQVASGRDAEAAAYAALLRDCPVLELTGGVDFEAAAAVCMDFLHHARL